MSFGPVPTGSEQFSRKEPELYRRAEQEREETWKLVVPVWYVCVHCFDSDGEGRAFSGGRHTC